MKFKLVIGFFAVLALWMYISFSATRSEKDLKSEGSRAHRFTPSLISAAPSKPKENESAKILKPEEYIQWINHPDNGMIETFQGKNIACTVQYLPAEYEVLMKDGWSNLSQKYFLKEVERKKDLRYFLFKIETQSGADILQDGLSSQEEYYSRLEYFSFKMQQDLFLLEGSDTLACKLFHYERNFEAAPYTTFMTVFENKDSAKHSKGSRLYSGDKTFIYKDKIFGNADVSLVISKKSLSLIPKINL